MATETPRKFTQDEYTHQPHPDQRPEEHEQSDVKIRPLVIFIIFFAGVTAATLLGMRLMIAFFKAEAARSPENQRKSLVASQPIRFSPEVPVLQGIPGPQTDPRAHGNTPAQDMRVFAETNRRIMEEGVPGGAIPIARAMEEALKKDIYKNDLQAARVAATQPAPTTRPAQAQTGGSIPEGGDGRK